MIKISGIVLTHNNEKTIKKCIESMKGVINELIIIDDYSTDKTLKVIKNLYPGVRVYKRRLNKDFASQRNFALTKAKNEWVLMIDSDEYLSVNLKKEILHTLKNPKFDQYISRRDNYFFGKYMKSDSGRPILLKKYLKFYGKLHENTKGKKGYLKSILYHVHEFNIERWMEKLNYYSTIDAEKWIEEKRNYNIFQLLLIGTLMPVVMFFKWYFKDGYWKNGLAGLFYSLGSAYIWTYKAFKYYKLKIIKNEKRTKTWKI